MSADSLRGKGMSSRHMTPTASGPQGQLVRPSTVSEKTLMESVAGLINEVGLVTQV